jgi:hypothetical protein
MALQDNRCKLSSCGYNENGKCSTTPLNAYSKGSIISGCDSYYRNPMIWGIQLKKRDVFVIASNTRD